MIIRILGEGQFAVDDAELDGLQELDRQLETAVESGDEQQFRTALATLLDRVRSVGKPVADDELTPSDAILPGAEAHVDEVRAVMLEDGVIPG